MVEFTQGYGQSSVPDPFDVLNGGDSIPSLPFNMKNEYGQDMSVPPGTEFILTLDRDLETKQQRNFETKELEYWDAPANTQPKWNVVITGDAKLPNGQPLLDPAVQDDDGKRRFYARNQSMRALQDAIRDAGGTMIGKGSILSIKLVGLKNTGKGQPQKLYEFKVLQAVQRVTAQQAQAMQAVGATQPQAAPVQAPQFTGQPQYAPPLGQTAQQQYPGYAQPNPPQAVQEQPVGQPGVAQFAPQPEQAPVQQAPVQQQPAQQAAPVDTTAAMAKVNALTAVGIAPEAAVKAVVDADFGGDEQIARVLIGLLGQQG